MVKFIASIPKPVKFLIAGGVAALIEYGAFIVIIAALPNLVISGQVASYLIGFFVSFWLQRNWVFKSAGAAAGDLVKYSILAGINLVLGAALIWVLVHPLEVSSYIAKFIVMAMVAVWNYVVFNKIIFSEPKLQHKE